MASMLSRPQCVNLCLGTQLRMLSFQMSKSSRPTCGPSQVVFRSASSTCQKRTTSSSSEEAVTLRRRSWRSTCPRMKPRTWCPGRRKNRRRSRPTSGPSRGEGQGIQPSVSRRCLIGHVTLAVITGATIFKSSHHNLFEDPAPVDDTRRFHLRVPDVQMNYSDLTKSRDTRIVAPTMPIWRTSCPIDIDSRILLYGARCWENW